MLLTSVKNTHKHGADSFRDKVNDRFISVILASAMTFISC